MTKTKVVAITACITGVAHTYMAEANLRKYAKKENCEINIETQGAMGVEHRLSQSNIDEADIVIFAVDTAVVGKERFENKKILKVGTAEVIKNGEDIFKRALNMIGG
ncbi:fructose PTS transporter subunit IIB [Carnobacterium sp.]|uniref:PTS fructose transporter subunit IIB n=1 Tax=Carnobacterium sp. TaxID=48221 RepID=UPI0028AEDA69|nr:fructose PTS transporter subunit IIB [Carnobacterium sp.]